jgi:hypothetical protein
VFPTTAAPTALRNGLEGDGTTRWVSPTGARAQPPPWGSTLAALRSSSSSGPAWSWIWHALRAIGLSRRAALDAMMLSPLGLLGDRGDQHLQVSVAPDHSGSDRRVAGGISGLPCDTVEELTQPIILPSAWVVAGSRISEPDHVSTTDDFVTRAAARQRQSVGVAPAVAADAFFTTSDLIGAVWDGLGWLRVGDGAGSPYPGARYWSRPVPGSVCSRLKWRNGATVPLSSPTRIRVSLFTRSGFTTRR